ncbi:cytochrome P450 [Rhodoligotrophos defluvii]|uniref:cytochrome P450 n=1 Tax=Rhodoligotrophos defluvii TaxID=2561934 RepID=UPI0010C9CD48|nr:cytochrome P450 [Rhodoligotrophos defluvii]
MAKGFFGEPFFMDGEAGLQSPFGDLRRYQAEKPVYYHPPLQQWFVFAYDDVAALFRDARLSSERMKGFVDQAPEAVREALRDIAPMFRSWVLMSDEPQHMRLRHLINLGFNASAIEALRPTIERSTDELLGAMRGGRSFDVCGEFAFLLPAYVLSDFLGVPPKDRDLIVQWSVDFIDFFNIFPITVDSATRMVNSARAMEAYTLDLLAARRRHPRDDFLGTLSSYVGTPDGPTNEEIVGNSMLLLLAGHVAVRNLIGNVVYLLATWPQERARLDADPNLLNSAIEETLRFEPPITLIPRIAREPVEVGNETIPAGAVVQLSIAAANRDPAHFPDPDRFDIARNPKRILSFGHGPHGCAGVHLARLQTQIAVGALLARFPRFKLDEEQPITWYRTAANRGPINLPIVA